MVYVRSRLEIECQSFFTSRLVVSSNATLYHYSKAESVRAIISSKVFRLSHYKRTNDGGELLAGMNLVEEVLKQCMSRNELTLALYENFHKFLLEEKKNPGMHLYLGCFCKRPDNDHLLSNYSCNEGRYIETQLSPIDIGNDPLMVRVIYNEGEFIKLIKDIFLGYQDYIIWKDPFWSTFDFKQLFLNDLFISILKDVFILSAMYKRDVWSKEEEVRIMNFLPTRTDYIELRLNNSTLALRP